MEKNFFIKPIPFEECSDVADVHLRAFPNSALTRLGKEAVSRYYQWQLAGPHECVAVGAYSESGEMRGYIFGGIFHGSLSGFVSKNRWFLIRQVLLHPWLISNPIFLDRIKIGVRSLVLGNKKNVPMNMPQSQSKNFGVLSIAVDPNVQGSGIGKALMQNVEFEAKQRGFIHMGLTVHPTNIQAIIFYERLSWQRIEIDGVWSGKMGKDL